MYRYHVLLMRNPINTLIISEKLESSTAHDQHNIIMHAVYMRGVLLYGYYYRYTLSADECLVQNICILYFSIVNNVTFWR